MTSSYVLRTVGVGFEPRTSRSRVNSTNHFTIACIVPPPMKKAQHWLSLAIDLSNQLKKRLHRPGIEYRTSPALVALKAYQEPKASHCLNRAWGTDLFSGDGTDGLVTLKENTIGAQQKNQPFKTKSLLKIDSSFFQQKSFFSILFLSFSFLSRFFHFSFSFLSRFFPVSFSFLSRFFLFSFPFLSRFFPVSLSFSPELRPWRSRETIGQAPSQHTSNLLGPESGEEKKERWKTCLVIVLQKINDRV